jgi:hypothetical protein
MILKVLINFRLHLEKNKNDIYQNDPGRFLRSCNHQPPIKRQKVPRETDANRGAEKR